MQPRSFRHVTKRGGVYQYQRRVPKAVIDRPEAHQLLFRGQPVYRKTLGTGVYAEALAKASVAEIEFDGLVAAAACSVPAVQSLPARPIRSLDAVGLAEASRTVRDRIVSDWRRDIVHAEVDATAAKYLDWRIAKTRAAQEANSDRSKAWGKPGDTHFVATACRAHPDGLRWIHANAPPSPTILRLAKLTPTRCRFVLPTAVHKQSPFALEAAKCYNRQWKKHPKPAA